MRTACPLLACLALVAACSGKSSGGGETDGPNGGTGVTFEDFVHPDAEATGDFSCFTPGADWASTTWLTQTPVSPGTFPLNGIVNDFDNGFPLDNANVALWYSDSNVGPADTTSATDQNGAVAFADVPACQRMTYQVTTDPVLAETKTTYKAHQVYSPPGASGSIDDVEFLSVSSETYQLIPSLLGITVDSDKGIVAGTAFDCTRDPSLPPTDDSGKVQNVQVIVYDENDEIPASLTVNYFEDEFPDRDPTATSADGLWVAANVPPGNLRIEMWGLVNGATTLLGATEVVSEADAINLGNVFTGYGDGVKYPDVCEGGTPGTTTGSTTGTPGTTGN